jgi:hypothetical protein
MVYSGLCGSKISTMADVCTATWENPLTKSELRFSNFVFLALRSCSSFISSKRLCMVAAVGGDSKSCFSASDSFNFSRRALESAHAC